MKWLSVYDSCEPEPGKQYLIKYNHRGVEDICTAFYDPNRREWYIATPWCGCVCYPHIADVVKWSSAPIGELFS